MISILMSVKNGAAFLAACLDSIRVQTFLDWELLVVDDHSSDDTFQRLKKHAEKEPRFRVFKNGGNGIIDALRLGFEHSTGTFITRMDADDLMPPRKLEWMHDSLLNAGKGSLAVGLVKYFSETILGEGYQKYAGWLNELTSASANFNDLYKECSIPSACWMIHREDLESVGHFRANVYPEDYDLAFRFRKANLQLAPVLEICHLWRDHSDRASRNDPHYLDNRFSALKVKHFISTDYNPEKQLYLWGAGERGKDLAKHLLSCDINFRWLTNNENKIGRDIYGVILESEEILGQVKDAQVIVNISARDAKGRIEEVKLQYADLAYFYFC